MDEGLLIKEQELIEINKKLERRARELLEKVDCLKSASVANVSKFGETNQQRPNKLEDRRSRSVSALNKDDINFTKAELQSLHLPEDINNVGAKGFLHFLKSKVKQLQFELDKSHIEVRVKTEELRKVQKDNLKLQEDKEKFLQQSNIARSHVHKLEAQASIIQSKLQTKDSELVGLKKEIDTLNRDLKNVTSQSKCNESKYQRALDELSKLKISLGSLKQDERVLRDAHKKHTEGLHEAINRLEKQKTELLHGFKRQTALVENLKRQKTTIETLKLNDKIEDDFIELINSENQV